MMLHYKNKNIEMQESNQCVLVCTSIKYMTMLYFALSIALIDYHQQTFNQHKNKTSTSR